jgi:hypothetical protein
MMSDSDLQGEATLWLIAAGVSLVIALGLVMRRWRKVRALLNVKSDEVRKLDRRGVVAERLEERHWIEVFRATLERARRDFEPGESAVARAVATALVEAEKAGDALASLVREAALRALTGGDLGSVLLRTDSGLLVYALAIPARADDPRALNRCPAFADGWARHAETIRHAIADARSPRMLGLAYCLDPEARDGTLAVAYDEDGLRVATAPLADGAATQAGSAVAGRYEFSLANTCNH